MARKQLVHGINILWSLLLVACGAPSGTPPSASPTPFAGQPRSVVIDTDMASDDWMAILYLLQRPDVTIEAITITGTGEAHCEPATRNAHGLVALAGHEPVPIACGRDTPLQGTHTFPTSWREGVDTLFGLTLPEGSNAAPGKGAVELLTSAIQASPEKVSLLTLGPLTNVAEMFLNGPSLVDGLKGLYIMAGAVNVPGNIAVSGVGIENNVAEWNFYVDPHAANVVLHSGRPITLVPLDATNHASVTPSFYESIEDNHSSPEAGFVFDVLTENYDFIESGGFYFWDPLAAAILTDESLASFQIMDLSVIEEEGPQSGRTQPVDDGATVRVAVSADGQRFEQLFLEALNSQAP